MKMNSKVKKLVSSLVVTATIAMSTQGFVLAKEESIQNKEIKVYFNNEQIEFDQQPVIVDGRTKVPFRAIFETMGTVVYYRQSDGSILGLTRDGDTIQHTIGTNKAIINGVEKTYDSVSEIINDRTLIPVRMVADLLSASVEWKEKEREVTIDKEITTNEYHVKIRGILECVLDENFNPEDFKRYITYQANHWDMSPKQVVLDVNMDLDRELVERIIPLQSDKRWNPSEILGLVPKEEDIATVTNTEDNLVLVNKFNVLPDDYVPSNMYNINAMYESELGVPFPDAYMKEEAYVNYLKLNDDYKNESNEKRGFGVLTAFWDKYALNSNLLASESFVDAKLKDCTNYEKLNYRFGNSIDDLQTGLSFMLDLSSLFDSENIAHYKEMLGYELTENDLVDSRYYHLFDDKCSWLRENSYKYGFIQRYPAGKEHITRMLENRGLYRYVGVDVAKIIRDNNWCLEEYYARYTNPSEYKTNLESTKQKVLSRY